MVSSWTGRPGTFVLATWPPPPPFFPPCMVPQLWGPLKRPALVTKPSFRTPSPVGPKKSRRAWASQRVTVSRKPSPFVQSPRSAPFSLSRTLRSENGRNHNSHLLLSFQNQSEMIKINLDDEMSKHFVRSMGAWLFGDATLPTQVIWWAIPSSSFFVQVCDSFTAALFQGLPVLLLDLATHEGVLREPTDGLLRQ